MPGMPGMGPTPPALPPAPPTGFGAPYASGMPHGYPPPAYPPAYPYTLQPTFPQPYPVPPGPPGATPFYGAPPPAGFPPPYPAAQPFGGQPPPPSHMQMGMQPPPPGHGFVHPAGASVPMDNFGLPVVPGDAPVQFAQSFRVEERVVSTSRDSFIVRDQQGTTKYKVDGQIISINERKIMKDVHGQTLLKLREARLKMREKITIFNARDVALITLQKASAIQLGTKRVNGYLGGQPAGSPAVIITGNHNNTHFRMVNAQNREIADIRRRKFSLKNMLTDQDTYDVTVNFGSPALICFLTVAIDEIYED